MQQRLILASGSPRRKELLSNLQLEFDVIVSEIEEIVDNTMTPEKIVMSLALQKAEDVARHHRDAFVIGSDTVVVFQNEVLGKPKNEEDSFRMLRMLSNQTHQVYTGVAILTGTSRVTFFERTDVTFWELSESEIAAYISSGEPKDKAGSYGIQELGSVLVKGINGDYFSVVGLPISRTIRELKKAGYII
ncbi:Maf family protein [Litchfieldia salsa]|uniref:dTTP/UTP pyrophosphatase n=1 Tax=Litchfieldia salsa TaxID=930152 RepID=A0A1H0NUC1_9BACI|nr:Maf family protein [Litchfieldia salsa]SDO95990.1 septum formation protein [Litchfieldia salsa]